jgi:hypothetical protein
MADSQCGDKLSATPPSSLNCVALTAWSGASQIVTVEESWANANEHILKKIDSEYPPLGKATRLQGKVLLKVTISKNGAVATVSVVSRPAGAEDRPQGSVKSRFTREFSEIANRLRGNLDSANGSRLRYVAIIAGGRVLTTDSETYAAVLLLTSGDFRLRRNTLIGFNLRRMCALVGNIVPERCPKLFAVVGEQLRIESAA